MCMRQIRVLIPTRGKNSESGWHQATKPNIASRVWLLLKTDPEDDEGIGIEV